MLSAPILHLQEHHCHLDSCFSYGWETPDQGGLSPRWFLSMRFLPEVIHESLHWSPQPLTQHFGLHPESLWKRFEVALSLWDWEKRRAIELINKPSISLAWSRSSPIIGSKAQGTQRIFWWRHTTGDCYFASQDALSCGISTGTVNRFHFHSMYNRSVGASE